MQSFLARDERFLGLDDLLASPDDAGVVILPVPFEKTSSYVTGSVAGPATILAASQQVELFDCELGFEPCKAAGGIATLSPLRVDDDDDGKSMFQRVENIVSYWLAQDKKVITLAGEHTGVVGAILANVQHISKLTVLQLDAHSDTRSVYWDDPWNHACTMTRVFDFHQDVVQVGIRSEVREERECVERMGIPVFRGATIQREDKLGIDWISPIIEACQENVYMTLDCDAMDPTIMPATGTPEPGGLTWEQINSFIARLCEERNVVGFDLSELSPITGIHYPEFAAAKLIYRFIGHIFNNARFGKR